MSNEPRLVRQMEDERTCRIALRLDDKDVSWCWVFSHRMRIGSATVSMGGIGGVETLEAYRRRGFARRVLEDSTAYMNDAGLDVGFLFGIGNFYERWGYAPVFADYNVYVPIERLPKAIPRYAILDFAEEHIPAVLDIYAENNVRRTGTVLRSLETWEPFPKGTGWSVDPDPKVFVDHRNRVVAYLNLDRVRDRTRVAEIGAARPDVYPELLAYLAMRAREDGHDEFSLAAPPDHPFVRYLRRFGCRVTVSYPVTGGAMARVIRLRSLFGSIAPELGARLRSGPLRDWKGKLLLRTDLGAVTLEIASGDVEVTEDEEDTENVLEIPQHYLIQLLLGYRDIETLLLEEEVATSGEAVSLVQVLFPIGEPYMWWPDRF